MSTEQSTRFPIVVAIDGSEYSQIVLEHAFDQAARYDACDLHFLRVVDSRSRDLEPVERWLAHAVFEGMEAFRQAKAWRARIHVRRGDPAEEIANLAEEIGAGLMVIGRYGGHRKPFAARVLELTSRPMLVIGLAGRELDRDSQCPQCVELRAESDGNRWFCVAHAAPGRMRLSTLVAPTTSGGTGLY